MDPPRLFHLRREQRSDVERLARVMTGQAVGLVLSGGAARAYAHVGVIRALREADVPIDLIGGSSMGAVIGAGVAMGWDDAELDWRLRKAFVESSPVDDIAFPMIAMTHGNKVRARLAEHFGDRTISDLWLPFFCVSSNLTTGHVQLHRDGPVRKALRASLSMPGLLPPVIQGENVLVDGAVLNNYPADIMRRFHDGPIIGVDVGRGRSIDARDVRPPKSILRWLFSGEWRNGPPIVSLMMRAAFVTASRETLQAHLATDVLISPDVEDIEIRDWKAYDPAVAKGWRAAVSALAAMEAPITDLRRRSRQITTALTLSAAAAAVIA
jgi:NTE family protein